MIDLFKNQDKIVQKVINAIKIVSEDCPEFQKILDSKMYVIDEMKKDAKQKYNKMQSDFKEGKKI